MARGRHGARHRTSWRPLAVAAVGASVLLTSGYGVWAGLFATATSAAETTTTGTLRLAMTGNGVGFSQPVSVLAPGDTVHRYVDLAQSGTLDAQQLTLSLAASTSNALVGTDAKALRLSVASCSGAWTPATGACTGTTTVLVAATTTVAAVISAPVTIVPGTLVAGSTTRLRVTLLLPDNDEVSTNGAAPVGSIQGLSTSLTYTFTQQQRIATTTSS
jgi:hypothetical protein